MAGRQADVLELSAADRTFLESQVRRHKAPRSLSDRCRMVLLCADGLQSKEVAERLGVHEHTVEAPSTPYRNGGSLNARNFRECSRAPCSRSSVQVVVPIARCAAMASS